MSDSQNTSLPQTAIAITQLLDNLEQWATELGFQQLGIANTELSQNETWLEEWLAQGCHGDMTWMASHGSKRSRPAELEQGTLSVISVRMDYLPEAADSHAILADANKAFISRYALGRDYHKLMRKRLQQLADRIEQAIGPFGYRVFVDSAPVMEKPLGHKAGLGWTGKHTNLINKDAGSWFFLGEIYTSLPLPASPEADNHCGTCNACIDICPTRAITAPYKLDARLCISYLTIEHQGSIPLHLRPLLGNRIYGCDDCQLCCPWNRFARVSEETDFSPRRRLDDISLVELFGWDEQTFLQRTEGSAIRRIGHERWLRNIAVALGNATTSELIIQSLQHQQHPSELVREHVQWALQQHAGKTARMD